MNKIVLRELITTICDDYIDTLLVGIEEYEKDSPYTIACTNFIAELKSKNITVNFNDAFIDKIRDKFYRETSNYLAR